MDTVARLLAAVMTLPVFIPFAAFAIVYFFLLWRKKNRREAVTLAVNVTTFFLIAAVTMMHGLIKGKESLSAIWWVLLFFLGAGGMVGFLQYKVKGRMNANKMVRAVWRLAFVFFTIAYFILFFSGIQHFLELT